MPPKLRSSSDDVINDDVINFFKSDTFECIISKIVEKENDRLKSEINDLKNEVLILKETNIQLIHMLSNSNVCKDINTSDIYNISSNKTPQPNKKQVSFSAVLNPLTEKRPTEKQPNPDVFTTMKISEQDTGESKIETNKKNDDGWQTVARKSQKSKKKLEVICGRDTSSVIKSAPRISHLHVYNLEPTLSTDVLVDYLKSRSIEGVECVKLQSKYPERYSSFKVSFPHKYHDRMIKPEFWPEDVRVNRFLFRLSRKKDAE